MKRIVGAGLFGLGVLLLIFAAGLPLFVVPAVSQLPYDLEKSTSVAESASASFLQIKSGGATIESGPLRSTVEVLPQAKLTMDELSGDLKGTAMVWDVYQSVRRPQSGELINAYSTELAIDRRSGAAADWDAAWLKDGTDLPPNYTGQMYKFPFGTEKKDYQVYDRDLRQAFPAQFKEVTKVRGVEVYRFEQVIPEQPLRIGENSLKVLLGTFAPGATGGQVVYRNTRTFWVEPITGSYVDYRDQPFKELRPDGAGSPTVLLQADFRYNEATVKASAARAADSAGSINLLDRWLPIGLGVLGVLAVIIGGWLALGGGRFAARHRHGQPDPPPNGPDNEQSAADGTLADLLPPAPASQTPGDQAAPR